MRPGVDIGIFRDGQERLARFAAARARVARPVTAEVESVTWPTHETGRYISPTLRRLIVLVARHADVSPESIRGSGRQIALVNARFCIANLAEEFAPRLSCNSIDDGMLRGEGMALWYRDRHRDRIEMYPNLYGALYERCRAELLRRVSP